MFTYTHPSWWKPRYAPATTGLGPRRRTRSPPRASRLRWAARSGWLIQLDGDEPAQRVPQQPVGAGVPADPAGREREAMEWLAKHIEGEVGYDATKEPLKTILLDSDREYPRRGERARGSTARTG